MKLKFVVKSIEQEIVILVDDNQAVVWPKNKLPEDLREGQTIYFTITDSSEVEPTASTMDLSPVSLLNDILKI